MYFSYEDLQRNVIMAKTYSFYATRVNVRVVDESGTVPEWKRAIMYISVRLEDKLYSVPGVRLMTGMLPVSVVKQADPLAVIYPEYNVSDAIKKSFVHKLNITLIPQNPDSVVPEYGSNYKTTLVVNGDFQLNTFIPEVLSPFVWQLGVASVPYVAKPGSISPIGGRKNKEKF